MFGFFKKKDTIPEAPTPEPLPDGRLGALAVDWGSVGPGWGTADRVKSFAKLGTRPMNGKSSETVAMDGMGGDIASMDDSLPNLSDAIYLWYARQGFIGHQMAAIIAQHWLIAKACNMPARDALRKGWELRSLTGETLPDEVVNKLRILDKRMRIKETLAEFLGFGRQFGVRIAIPVIDYGDVETTKVAYEAPFNIDGVRPGAFKGWVQVDPYWTAPELDSNASGKPDSMHFYDPTWWQINGQRYHRSHLCVYRHGRLADILKPAYQYGGIPVPQLIMERIYAAERSANEAPMLALTKRTVVMKTDMAKAVANWDKFTARVAQMSAFWTNYGTRVIDKDEEHQQQDTGLADLDALIMTQYQLVAAAAEVPSTKLLGTSPKGFNATGEHDESNYHEALESMQEADLTPFLVRHYELAIKSLSVETNGVDVLWPPMDAPTELESAQTEAATAQAAAAYVGAGIVSPEEERKRLARTDGGLYAGIIEEDTGPGDDSF